MANDEHVEVVRQGAEAVAEWGRLHPGVRLDLSGAQLSRAHLQNADLTDSHLAGANLLQANLIGAQLSGADMSESSCLFAICLGANLSGARLYRAKLMGACFLSSDLSGADLTGANLTAAFLAHAQLSGAKLVGANLAAANLIDAELSLADLTGATLGRNCFGSSDLSQVVGLASVTHEVGSSVGTDTLAYSLRGAGGQLAPDLLAFFRGAGVPDELLEALPAILAEVKYCTCFTAYGQPDLEFARRLREDLESRGVSCWLYDMDATAGERTWLEIGRKRQEAEKFVVLCSAKALIRDGVVKEIEEQVDEDPDKLVPISLDDVWKETGFRVMRGNRDLKPHLLERNYADFANLPYDEALERLLTGLTRSER